MPKTVKVPLSPQSEMLPSRILAPRLMTNAEFVEKHGSGTLRDNAALGFVTSIQCLAERVAYTFGYGFASYKQDRVVFNDSISECDEPAYTQSGRWFKAYLAKRLFDEDYFEIKYVSITEHDGSAWEGIGIIVRETSALFVPDGVLIVAKLAQYDAKRKAWEPFVNFA